jgi:hypothetical protein
MGNKISWLPSSDTDIYAYRIERASAESGPFSPLATIIHNLANPLVFDSAAGKFFYVDSSGIAGNWYVIVAIDNTAEESTPAAFQATSLAATSNFTENNFREKGGLGAVYPIGATADSWGILEPLIDPSLLKMRHLFGIPLMSYAIDPMTGKRQVFTDAILEDSIKRAVAVVEAETHINIMPKTFRKKFPFDRQAYASLGYLMLPDKPVISLLKFAVTASNGSDLYIVPPDWIETAYITTGQINIVPMTIAFMSSGFMAPTNSGWGGNAGGSAFLSILGQNPWIPAYWQCDYMCGFPDGRLPTLINELVGMTAAIDVLGLLATTNARNSSHSVGMDGISQSISTPGPQIYDTRITMLKEQKDILVNKVRSAYGTKLFTGVM